MSTSARSASLCSRKEFHRYLERIVDAGFGSRVMFGSDQMNWPGVIEYGIEAIETATFLTPTAEARHSLQQRRSLSPVHAGRDRPAPRPIASSPAAPSIPATFELADSMFRPWEFGRRYTADVRKSPIGAFETVDRSAVTVQSLHDEPDERRWWWSRPVAD